jgi:hypothetical protein
MMQHKTVAFTNITITDPGGKHHNSVGNLVIDNGGVVSFDSTNPAADAFCIDAMGLHASPGIFDFQVQGGEPGFEDRERFETLNLAALVGRPLRMTARLKLKLALESPYIFKINSNPERSKETPCQHYSALMQIRFESLSIFFFHSSYLILNS